MSISLRHWHSGSECLSDWRQGELVKLRKLIDKVQMLSYGELVADDGLQFKPHKGPPARGFSRPSSLSGDVPLYEMRVDGKARVHGALHGGVFHLVWLDRNHAVFPNGK